MSTEPFALQPNIQSPCSTKFISLILKYIVIKHEIPYNTFENMKLGVLYVNMTAANLHYI